MNLKEINIYTDGSCIGNPGPGSYCYKILFIYNNTYKKYINKNKYQYTTNNRMELLAVIEALSLLNNNMFKNINITIYSDSKYVLDPINKKWLFTWARKWI